jgi:hypothetical protein
MRKIQAWVADLHHFNSDSDPDPASDPTFYPTADPNPASQNNADPDPQSCRKEADIKFFF